METPRGPGRQTWCYSVMAMATRMASSSSMVAAAGGRSGRARRDTEQLGEMGGQDGPAPSVMCFWFARPG